MDRIKQLSPWQFTTFRILLGAYLAIHFFQLVPYAAELFSTAGLLPDSSANFTYGVLPNPLDNSSPAFATAFVIILGIAALGLATGINRPLFAIILWYGWACLFNRNNLISNPGIPYVGLLLILCALIPRGEPLSLRWRRQKPNDRTWHMPALLYWCAWGLLAAGYSYSGYWKLHSPSWIDGTAMEHLLLNPLARPNWITAFMLELPPIALKGLTWFALAGELLALPFLFHRKTRLISWCWMLMMHVGIVMTVDFADLTIAMVLIHLFTFDPEWLPAVKKRRSLVLFDGTCALCSSSVKFFLKEDHGQTLEFAPLQGETARAILLRHDLSPTDFKSIMVINDRDTDQEKVYLRSRAVLEIVRVMGGFLKCIYPAILIPAPFRDAIYDFIAERRYKWFGRTDACELPKPEWQGRFHP